MAYRGRLLNQLQQARRPVVVDIWGPWCAPCRLIEPALRELEQEYQGRVDLVRLNADEDPESARDRGVIGIPTLIAVSAGGEEIARRAEERGVGAECIARGSQEH